MKLLNKYPDFIERINTIKYLGKVVEVSGLTVKSLGPQAEVGEVCSIQTNKKRILAEVIGLKNNIVILMPYDEIDSVRIGSVVIASASPLTIPLTDMLLGRVLDGIARPIDSKGDIFSSVYRSIYSSPPNPLSRKRIDRAISTGIKAIDGPLTIGEGQRMGIFAGTGVGKSTLLSMIARHSNSDVNVIALVGERGREVREFIEKELGEEGLKKSVLVVSTSDTPPLMRVKAAFVATTIAEYFRDKGKKVIFVMDSITRFARAQRELGLAAGEPPTTRGFPPSVYTVIPKLVERTGMSKDSSITSFYTVLVEGDDFNEPVSDNVRGVLDGHIMLDRELAVKGQYPAVSIIDSISRLSIDIVSEKCTAYINKIKEIIAIYKENEDFIKIGAYVKGTNEKIDYALSMIDKINGLFKQGIKETLPIEQTFKQIFLLFGDNGFSIEEDLPYYNNSTLKMNS